MLRIAAITADCTALALVNRLRRRRRSVKRTGNGRPSSGRTGSDDRKSTTQRKPCIRRRRSRSSSRKLNSTSGWDASREASETRPRENGFHNTGPKLAICRPVAFHDDLLCTLTQRSVAGQPGNPDDRRKQDTCNVRRLSGCRAARRSWAPKNRTGWFMRLRPTPRRSARGSMPCSRRCSCGPSPERIIRAGEKIAPAHRITSRARKSRSSPSTRARTPVMRRPSIRRCCTSARVRMVRLLRRLTLASR